MKSFVQAGLLFFMLGFSGTAFTQTNVLDDKYSPPGNSVFDQKTSTNSNGGYDIKNVILIEPLYIGRGVLAATYRRQLGASPLSASFTAGKILFKDFAQMLIDDVILGEDFGAFSIGGSEPVLPLSAINRNFNIAPGDRRFLQFTFGTTFGGKGTLKGGGLELGIRFHDYRLETSEKNLSDENYSYSEIAASSVQVKSSTFFIQYRIQFAGNGRRPFAQSLSYSLGIRKSTYDGFELTPMDEADGFSGVYQRFQLSGAKETILAPSIMFNYSLGMGW